MNMPRIFSSSKFQASLISTILLALPACFSLFDKNLDRDKKQETAIAAIIAIAGVWGVSIHATGREDAAAKSAANPQVQVNTADNQAVTAQAPSPGANQQAIAQAIAQIMAHIQQANKTQSTPILPPLNQGTKT